MKKLVVLLVALAFLATFTLGCNQSPPPAPKPAAQKAAPAAPAPAAEKAAPAAPAAPAPAAPAPAPEKK